MLGKTKTAVVCILLILTTTYSKAQVSQQAGPMTESSHDPTKIQLIGRVNDVAGLLSEGERLALSLKLEELERVTGSQLVVVTVPSLGGHTISAYTLALANRWEIGRKDINDGVVLLVAPNERQLRIEVGLGLESTLTDDICRLIIAEKIAPNFRHGNFFGGIDAGTTAIIENLKSNSGEQ